MATISSLGVGSNLNLSSLLDQLQTAESLPLKDIQARATSFTSKLSAYGQVTSALTTLQNAAKKLADPAFFQSVKTSVTASDVLGATADGTAVASSYAVNVTQLAQSQSLITGGQASAKTAIGNGTITIDFGAISGGSLNATTGQYAGAAFTQDAARKTMTVNIDSDHNTLEGIRDAINAAKGDVTASIVNDGSGTPNRLVLVSAKSGEASSMRVSVAGDAALQNLLGNDPAGTQNLQQTVVAQNAKLVVNGIAVTSASNTVQGAMQGTTLNLLKVGATSVTMTTDTASVETAVNDLVKAYNSLLSTSSTLTAYNADTKTGAALMGDSTLRNLMTRVRQTFVSPQDTGANSMKVLSEIGVSFQKDGTLAVDATKLHDATTKNLSGVANLFSSAAGSTGGYGKQLSAVVDDLTGTNGVLVAATKGVNSTLDDLSKQYNAMQARVDSTVARYKAQFTQLDVMINSMNNTLAYLKQQFDSISSSSSN